MEYVRWESIAKLLKNQWAKIRQGTNTLYRGIDLQVVACTTPLGVMFIEPGLNILDTVHKVIKPRDSMICPFTSSLSVLEY